MNPDWDAIAKIAAPIIALVGGAIIKHYTEGKAKLISFLGHVSNFTVAGETPMRVFAHSVIVRNAGRKSAHNVRIGHLYLPDNVNVEPPVAYTIKKAPQGPSGEIILPVLVPGEQVTVSYLYYPPVTYAQINAYAKCDEGQAKIITVLQTPQASKHVIRILGVLVLLGASLLVYWAIRLAAYWVL